MARSSSFTLVLRGSHLPLLGFSESRDFTQFALQRQRTGARFLAAAYGAPVIIHAVGGKKPALRKSRGQLLSPANAR